ncbi:MAG: carboxymuconolactone decarboxylase family protein [Betaproteobacteria bacterium]|nr:carboxymuconolactone decarboxylase family protein [Betaproteobacteria bacterium]
MTDKQETYTVAPERLAPIPEGKMTEAQKKAAAEIAAGRRGSVRGPFHAFLRSPTLMGRVQKLGEYLRYDSLVEQRLRELAALMAARDWTQQYEWHAHVPHALKAGLKAEVIEAVAEGRRPAGMAADEEIVHDFVRELLANRGVSDPTYERALKQFGEAGVVELISVVGYYALLAMVMNVARTAVPDGKPLPLPLLPQQLRVKG